MQSPITTRKIDLSGVWQVCLRTGGEMTPPADYPEQMTLPGTTSCAGLWAENDARETGFLTDTHKFEGQAWFSRTFIAGDWAGQQVLLTLERTRRTTVYIDGICIGHQESLCTPHRYLLPEVAPGNHTLVVCVDNTGYPTRGGHLTAPDTQTNWNGVTGEISLTVARAIVSGIRVHPDPDASAIRVRAEVIGAPSGEVRVCAGNSPESIWTYQNGLIDGVYPLTDTPLWDELTPAVQTLRLTIGSDSYETTFGLRRFRTEGRHLLCDDRELFLRGKHDALLFPLTGYAPTDVDTWRRILGTAMAYGINHYRFHTCCPPDAAFTAADELGIFMAPELPFWGTVAAKGEEGYDERERAFLISEGFAMLREFGHHPSFMLLSMGNELWGSKPALNRMLADYRAYDPDKLYVSGSNNFQFVPDVLDEEDVFVGVRFSRDRLIRGSYAMCDAPQGIIQTTEPESVRTFDQMIVPARADGAQQAGKVLIQYGTGVKEVDADGAGELIPQVPVIAHEVGQYEFYPDFSEIDCYTGPLKARSFEVFRQRLTAAGLWPEHERFFRAAGRLAIDCYRRELETFLRSRELSGFQLLDLQDYSGQGTALVGVLNAMMESKGLIAPEEWRQFCAGTVVLGEFDRFVLTNGDTLSFGVQISECDPSRRHTQVTCELLEDGRNLRTVVCQPGTISGRLTERVDVSLGVVTADQPKRLIVRLTLEDGVCNQYPLWVFPDCEVSITPEGITDGVRTLRFVPDAQAANGAPCIIVPCAEGKLKAEYCSDFWCYPMFRSISESMGRPVPTGTLGLCIRPDDPLLAGFPADEYTTPPWYRILAHTHCEPITDASPIVEMIDNTERCQRLGILYRQDGLLYLTARLWEAVDDPEVRCFAKSLLDGCC